MSLRLLALSILLIASPVAVAVAPATVAAASQSAPVLVVDAFHAAMGRADAAGVADLLLDDAVIFEQGGAESSKAEYVEAHLPGDIAYSQGMTDTIASRRSTVKGAIAWVLTQGRTTGTYDGKKVDRLTTETMVLKKTKEGWRIAHIHWSSRAAPAT
ncbi:MAG: nuclear transport factor 2 family protein [Caulobacter sp.]|nr:nuclear transport factor 2 family protein [Caulobacter sp.]